MANPTADIERELERIEGVLAKATPGVRYYWHCEVMYSGFERFYFYGPEFWSSTDIRCVAEEELLQKIAVAWAKISPHAAPTILTIIPGQVYVEKQGQPRVISQAETPES